MDLFGAIHTHICSFLILALSLRLLALCSIPADCSLTSTSSYNSIPQKSTLTIYSCLYTSWLQADTCIFMFLTCPDDSQIDGYLTFCCLLDIYIHAIRLIYETWIYHIYQTCSCSFIPTTIRFVQIFGMSQLNYSNRSMQRFSLTMGEKHGHGEYKSSSGYSNLHPGLSTKMHWRFYF